MLDLMAPDTVYTAKSRSYMVCREHPTSMISLLTDEQSAQAEALLFIDRCCRNLSLDVHSPTAWAP